MMPQNDVPLHAPCHAPCRYRSLKHGEWFCDYLTAFVWEARANCLGKYYRHSLYGRKKSGPEHQTGDNP